MLVSIKDHQDRQDYIKKYGKEYRKLPQVVKKRKEYYEGRRKLSREYRKKWHQENKERDNKRSREYYLTHKEEIAKQLHDNNQRIKQKVIGVYSGYLYSCKCCGEQILDFLTIDHIDGGGVKHRKANAGTQFYRWLIKNNFPNGFQVLCFNCNCAKGLKQNNNRCPHEVMRDSR